VNSNVSRLARRMITAYFDDGFFEAERRRPTCAHRSHVAYQDINKHIAVIMNSTVQPVMVLSAHCFPCDEACLPAAEIHYLRVLTTTSLGGFQSCYCSDTARTSF